MGNADTKLNFRKAVIQLTTKTQPVDAGDDTFWDQESVTIQALDEGIRRGCVFCVLAQLSARAISRNLNPFFSWQITL